MKKIAFVLALFLILPTFSGCADKKGFSESFFFMDTVIGVTLYTDDETTAEKAFSECRALLSELDALWARQKTGSDAARFNEAETGIPDLDPRTVELLETALDVSQRTDGAFDITVASLVDLWQTCGEKNQLPTDTEMSATLARTGYEKLALNGCALSKTQADVAIDLGGIGKGAAIGLLTEVLSSCGANGGLITFGSNVAVFGNKPSGEPFRIALRDPRNANTSVGTLLLPEGMILSVSGDYERYVTVGGGKYHHILQPSTGYPADSGLSSVAVITSDGALADALSTALFVMGKDRTMELYRSGLYDFEAILIAADGTLTQTDGLSEIFIKK